MCVYERGKEKGNLNKEIYNMEKLQSITIENNEQYLRQISKKVNIEDPELHNNIVVLQDYCM